MSQPPRGDEQPTAAMPGEPDRGHPEPAPDPEPPQPIPPPEPIPVPEPPHAAEPPQAVEPPQAAEPPTAPVTPEPATAAIDPQTVWQAPIPPSQQFHPSHEWHPDQGPQWHPGTPEHGHPHPHAHQPPLQQGAPQPPYQMPVAPAVAAPRRNTAFWVSVALTSTLLLCGGGAASAFLLLRGAEGGDGAPDPETAVTRFLTAVYSEQDASAANDLVCREARDTEKLTAKVDEIKSYSQAYDGPQFRWETPSVADQNSERAVVSVDLMMTTDDEKYAEQQLTFTVVKKTGWWVCEVAG